MNQNPVFRVVAKILFAPIIMFGLYVQFHGDFGPGGGFQAGVIIAAAFILHALVFGLQAGRQIISARVNLWMMVLGVTIYGAVGIVSMTKGGLYLDYTALTGSVGSGQHIGILVVEFGVGCNDFIFFDTAKGFVNTEDQGQAKCRCRHPDNYR